MVKIVWNSKTTELDGQSVRNRTLLEWLELENAELRGRVLHLVLQIQALRDGDRYLGRDQFFAKAPIDR